MFFVVFGALNILMVMLLDATLMMMLSKVDFLGREALDNDRSKLQRI
jgi:hypothetical protein